MTTEQALIDKVTHQFFSAFTNINGKKPAIQHLKKICIEQVVIINNNSQVPAIYTLESFIKPREELLTNGTLINFSESEISHNTEIFNTIAHRFSLYKKSGVLNGVEFYTEGMKTIQFIKVAGKWKICSIAWSDKK
ncbi:MAG: hypothetical protein JKY44_09365 [Flavobacteriaceae bacterium]|nr:hypothetical protein [Flavobacteriaceae bacterium]